jgi:CRISPR-associated protein Csa3
MGGTLVATIYKYEPIMKTVAKYDIERVVLIRERPELASEDDRVKKEKAIDSVKDSLGSVMDVEVVETELHDLYQVAEDTLETIRNEEGVVMNITGGRKPQAIGALMAASIAGNVEEVNYYSVEDDDITIIPKFDLRLSEKPKQVLQLVSEGKKPKEIVDELEMSQSMVYKHLNDLKEKDYVSKEEGWTLTRLGKLVLKA